MTGARLRKGLAPIEAERSGCRGKAKLRSYKKASESARRCSRREGKEINFYSCRVCGFYHLTSWVPR